MYLDLSARHAKETRLCVRATQKLIQIMAVCIILILTYSLQIAIILMHVKKIMTILEVTI